MSESKNYSKAPADQGRKNSIEKSETRELLHSLEATSQYVFHGSPTKDVEEFEPRQPHNWKNGVKVPHGTPCIAASPFADIAIFRSVVFYDTTSFGMIDDGTLVFRATEKALEMGRKETGYVYVFSRDQFTPFGDGKIPMEWRSKHPVKPLRVIEVTFRDLPEGIKIVPRRESITKETTNVRIKVATAPDATEIAKIQAETWLATYPNEDHGITLDDIKAKKLDDPTRIERWKTKIEDESGKSKTWVAREDQRIIGYCLAKNGDNENYIDALYILPTEQGRGVGEKLMSEALSWLGTQKPIGLGVASYNQQAIGFYKKMGFQKSEEAADPVPPLPSGKQLLIIKMVKPAQEKQDP